MSFAEIISKITKFRDDRDWAQFHSVSNLVSAINVEAGELQEAVLWKSEEEVRELLESDRRARVTDELADVLIYSMLLAAQLGEDPIEIMEGKLRKNERKYPIDLSKGKSTKYTDLPSEERD